MNGNISGWGWVISSVLGFAIGPVVVRASAPEFAWVKSAGGSGAEQGTGIATDSAGNTFVLGRFASPTISFDSQILTNGNLFLAKYDAAGNAAWAKPLLFPALGDSIVNNLNYRLGCDSAGNLYMGGSFVESPLTIGSTTLSNLNSGSWTLFLAKLDSAGNIIWSTTGRDTNTLNNIRAEAWAFDAAGNCYVSGDYGHAPDMGLPNAMYGVYAAKFDASGSVVWARQLVDSDSSGKRPVAMTVHPDGSYSIAGIFGLPTLTLGGTTLTNSSSPGTGWVDIFVARYDANGNLLWATSGGSTDMDFILGFASDATGSDYLAGVTQAGSVTFDGVTLTNSHLGCYLVKFAPSGMVNWCKATAISGPQSYRSGSIYRFGVDDSGNCYSFGIFDGRLSFDSTTITNPTVTASAYFLSKLDSSGQCLWAKVFGLIGNYYISDWVRHSELSDLAVDGLGNCSLTASYGRSNSPFDGYSLTPIGAEDVYVARLVNEHLRLEVLQLGDSLVLSWPADPPLFQLEASGSLNPTDWSAATNEVWTVGSRNFVTNGVAGNSQFFRLHKQ